MKVFEIVPTNEYFAGVAIVAADNINVAINIWKNYDERNDDLWTDGKCEIFENTDLIATTDVPKVIIDSVCEY